MDDFIARGYFGKDVNAARARFDALVEKLNSDETLSKDEKADLGKAQSEIAAIAAENVLGTADFIRRLVKGEPSRAEKILGKIVQIKNALTGEKGAAANREIAFVQKAERLYLNAIAELGGTYRDGKIHLANREEDEKARTAAEGAQFSAENSAESVDESGELRYNKRTTIDEKAGTDFLIRNFSGAVNVDYTKLYLSDQELAVISHSIKSGNGKLDKARKHGYVFSSNNFYSFVYNNDNSVTIANQYDIDTEKKLIEIERRAIEGDAGRRRKIRTAGAWIAFVRGGGTGDTSNTRDGLQSPGARRSSDPMDGSTRGSHNGGDLGRSGADRQNNQVKFNQDGRKATLTVNGETLNSIGKPVYFNDIAQNRRAIWCFGPDRYFVVDGRSDTDVLHKTVEAAIEAENESLIKGYAKEFFLSSAEVKRKLEADPDLLSRAQDNGILFSRKAPTDGQAAKEHADRNYGKIYTRKDAREIISAALAEHLTFPEDGVFGSLVGKSREQAIEVLWRGLNSAEEF